VGGRIVRTLQTLFKLHPLTVGDITAGGTLDKVEAFEPDYTFAVAHEPNFNEGWNALTDTLPVATVILQQAVVSIHTGVSRGITRVHALLAAGRLPTNAHIFASVLSMCSDLFSPLTDQACVVGCAWRRETGISRGGQVEDEAAGLEDIVLVLSQDEQGDLLRRFAWSRRHIADLGKVLRPKREMLKRLVRTDSPHIPESLKAYIRDPLDHVTRMLQQLEATSDMLEASLTTYNVRVRGGR
jgi:magnesium transporter